MIVVTGGSSMVGKSLKLIMPDATYLSSKDYNLLNENEVIKMYNDLKPDTVIHLAAKVGGMYDNIAKPCDYYVDNLVINTNVLKHAVENKVPRFIAILSTCLYADVASKYPITEDMILEGIPTLTNLGYGYSKRTMALQIDLTNQQYGTNYQYLIPSNLYGEYDKINDTTSHFVGALIYKLVKAKKQGLSSIHLKGHGNVYRQFLYSHDLAKVIKYVLDNNIYDNLNVATDENVLIKDIVKIALAVCDMKHLSVNWDLKSETGQYSKEVSIEKLISVMPSFEATPLSVGLRRTFNRVLQQL